MCWLRLKPSPLSITDLRFSQILNIGLIEKDMQMTGGEYDNFHTQRQGDLLQR